jgi:hypothetical protein
MLPSSLHSPTKMTMRVGKVTRFVRITMSIICIGLVNSQCGAVRVKDSIAETKLQIYPDWI